MGKENIEYSSSIIIHCFLLVIITYVYPSMFISAWNYPHYSFLTDDSLLANRHSETACDVQSSIYRWTCTLQNQNNLQQVDCSRVRLDAPPPQTLQ